MKPKHLLLVLAAFLIPGALDPAPVAAGGRKGEKAPKWEISSWANLPPGRKSLEVTDFRGRVLCLFNFQSW